MYTKEQIWNSYATDLHIMKHLAEKIPHGQEHHKPTEKQRTTLELLQYLGTFGMGMFAVVLAGDGSAFAKYWEESAAITVENFSAAIDREEAEMKKIFAEFNDENLAEVVNVWGRTQARAEILLDGLKMMASYKMQLFLYVKASGNHSIGTSNLWAGMDMPTPAA